MDGWHPYPATCIAQNLNMSVHKVRYHLRKLKIEGLVESFRENGLIEDGAVFCLWGWRITDKAINTLEYIKAFEEERKLCKECFDIDIKAFEEERKLCKECFDIDIGEESI